MNDIVVVVVVVSVGPGVGIYIIIAARITFPLVHFFYPPFTTIVEGG